MTKELSIDFLNLNDNKFVRYLNINNFMLFSITSFFICSLKKKKKSNKNKKVNEKNKIIEEINTNNKKIYIVIIYYSLKG